MCMQAKLQNKAFRICLDELIHFLLRPNGDLLLVEGRNVVPRIRNWL